MPTVSPMLSLSQITDPVPYTGVEGNWPNPEVYIQTELERIVAALETSFQSDDAAIVAYFNSQLAQINSLINGLAGGQELQDALTLLQSLSDIVDSDGNGILDALGPLQTQLDSLAGRVTAVELTQQAFQSAQQALQTNQQALQTTQQTHATNIADLTSAGQVQAQAILNNSSNLGRNLQAIRNAFQAVGVTYTPIALPAPVFATTNISNPSDPSDPSQV